MMISFSIVEELHGMKLREYKRVEDGYLALFQKGDTVRTFRFFVGRDVRGLSMTALRERPKVNYCYVVVPMSIVDTVEWMMAYFSLSRKLYENGVGIISSLDNTVVMRSRYVPVPARLDEVVQ